jgi:hypothetical protein
MCLLGQSGNRFIPFQQLSSGKQFARGEYPVLSKTPVGQVRLLIDP